MRGRCLTPDDPRAGVRPGGKTTDQPADRPAALHRHHQHPDPLLARPQPQVSSLRPHRTHSAHRGLAHRDRPQPLRHLLGLTARTPGHPDVHRVEPKLAVPAGPLQVDIAIHSNGTRWRCTGTLRTRRSPRSLRSFGISGVTLSAWCKAAGVPIRHRNLSSAAEPAPGVETPDQELARLRAENTALRAAEARLSTERDFLRSAAKYFAGETNWRAASSSSGRGVVP